MEVTTINQVCPQKLIWEKLSPLRRQGRIVLAAGCPPYRTSFPHSIAFARRPRHPSWRHHAGRGRGHGFGQNKRAQCCPRANPPPHIISPAGPRSSYRGCRERRRDPGPAGDQAELRRSLGARPWQSWGARSPMQIRDWHDDQSASWRQLG